MTGTLGSLGYAESLARIEDMPETWTVTGLWPQGTYGVLAAEWKAGKTWAAIDLAVSVATGEPWLDRFETNRAPVLYLFGEGDLRAFWKHAEAIARARGCEPAERFEGWLRVLPEPFDVRNPERLDSLAEELEGVGLVVLDPWYLSAGDGAKAGDLYGTGQALRGLQVTCQNAGTSLLVVHHWNRGAGTGSARMSGAGPAEWGRVLVSVSVQSRRVTSEGETDVRLRFEVSGSDVAERAFLVRRRVRSLSSEPWPDLSYRVEVEDAAVEPETSGLSRRAERLLRALHLAGPGGWTRAQLRDVMAEDGTGVPPLQQKTFERAEHDLDDLGLLDSTSDGAGFPAYLLLTAEGKEQAEAMFGRSAE